MTIKRRDFLSGLAATTLLAPAGFSRRASAQSGPPTRVIFFYFPDGVAGPSQDGDLTKWHAYGSEHDFQLGQLQAPLEPHKQDCVFLNGLSLGATDAGSHPGGAKKLLTGVDGGNGWSIDHYLAQGVGSGMPYRHLILGAQSTVNGASGDKHITYVAPGQSTPPEDNPLNAFNRVFSGFTPPPRDEDEEEAPPPPPQSPAQLQRASVIDGVLAEVHALRSRVHGRERAKIELHLEALRELEARIQPPPPTGGGGGNSGGGSLGEPALCSANAPGSENDLYNPARFPDQLRAQIDLTVAAMACGQTRVATIQSSHHTSELIMSRFEGTPMHAPDFDMRSHQASHYGARHDEGKAEYWHFVEQRKWFVGQFAYLIDQLKQRPEGEGTMLDHTLCVLCTEVCDGNTHAHDNIPFVLAGRAGGLVSTGRLLDYGYRRHSDLLTSIAHAMGDPISCYGDACGGGLPGLVS
jgi:hypothetical protein